MKYHLKLREDYYSLVDMNIKNFEIRLGDRDYKIGDTLMLYEIDLYGKYTGRAIIREIGYLMKVDVAERFYSKEEIEEYGLVVLGLEEVK